MSKIAIREKKNGTRNGINGMGLILKILLITAHEWQTRINYTILKNYEWYLMFMIGHYHLYFINQIELFMPGLYQLDK
jgi:hypothetical protein